MIIMEKSGNIFEGGEKRIAFAVNAEGINDAGFAGQVAYKYWPELSDIGSTELGTVISKKVEGIEFFALCCHSLEKGWGNPAEVIRKCFDAIPGDEPVASVSIGKGIIGLLDGVDFRQIKAGMDASNKAIILY